MQTGRTRTKVIAVCTMLGFFIGIILGGYLDRALGINVPDWALWIHDLYFMTLMLGFMHFLGVFRSWPSWPFND